MAILKHLLILWVCALSCLFAEDDSPSFSVSDLIKAWADNFVFVVDHALFDTLNLSNHLGVITKSTVPNSNTIQRDGIDQSIGETSFETLLTTFNQQQLQDASDSSGLGIRTYDNLTVDEIGLKIDPFSNIVSFLVPFWLKAITSPAVDPKPDANNRHGIADPKKNLTCFLYYINKSTGNSDVIVDGSDCESKQYVSSSNWEYMDAAFRFSDDELTFLASGIENGIIIEPDDLTQEIEAIMKFYMALDYYMPLLKTCDSFMLFKMKSGADASLKDTVRGPGSQCIGDINRIYYNNEVINMLTKLFAEIFAYDSSKELGRKSDSGSLIMAGSNIYIEDDLKNLVITSSDLKDSEIHDNYLQLIEKMESIKLQLFFASLRYFSNLIATESEPMLAIDSMMIEDDLSDTTNKQYECLYETNPLLTQSNSPFSLTSESLTDSLKANKFINLMLMRNAVPLIDFYLNSSPHPMGLDIARLNPLMGIDINLKSGISHELIRNLKMDTQNGTVFWSDADYGRIQRKKLLEDIRYGSSALYSPLKQYATSGLSHITGIYNAYGERSVRVLDSADGNYLCSAKQLSRQQASWRLKAPPKDLAAADNYINWTESIWQAEPVTITRHIASLVAELGYRYYNFAELISQRSIFDAITRGRDLFSLIQNFDISDDTYNAIVTYDAGTAGS